MKKMMLGLLCLIGVMSCEVPQSITVKGNPGVYLPLGSPFRRLDDAQRLENRINPNEIRKTISGSGTDDSDRVKVYDYQGQEVNKDVQAYIIRYPIVEMKLDLNGYIDDAMENDNKEKDTYTIPDSIFTLPSTGQYIYLTKSENLNDPLFTVPLNDMAKLVKEVNGKASADAFGLEITYTPSFEQYVEIKIPAFGIDDYIKGKKVGNTLRFVDDNTKTFIPKPIPLGKLNSKSEIEIFVRLTRPCSGTIDPKMVFDWESAIVKTDDNPINGKHIIKNELRTFLGEGAEFKQVTGYIYVTEIDTDTTITITAPGIDNINDVPIYSKPRPSFPDFDSDSFSGSLPSDSLNNPKNPNNQTNINLTTAFNSDSNSYNPNLEYDIKIKEMTIHPNDPEKIITADLVILIPLEFKISKPSPEYADYVKLELKDLFPQPGSGDLFMRTGKDNPEDLLHNLDTIKINLEHFENDITDDFNLLIASGAYSDLLELNDKNEDPFWDIHLNDLPYPFNPRFEILIKKEPNQSYGILKIKHQPPEPKFDFFLSVEAKAKINYKIDL